MNDNFVRPHWEYPNVKDATPRGSCAAGAQGPRVLFVCSGGGMPGLRIHAGIWLALEDAGIFPTAISGTSAGAIRGGIQATGWSARHYATFVAGLTDDSLRHPHIGWQVRFPWLDAIHENDRARALLNSIVPSSFASLVMPFAAWAIKMDGGAICNVAVPELSATPAAAILASAAAPIFLPPVALLDGLYTDGGTMFNLPLPADWHAYDEVWLLVGQGSPRDYQGSGLVVAAVRAYHQMMYGSIQRDLVETAGAPNVHVVWPRLRDATGMMHFPPADIIDRARADASVQISATGKGMHS